MKYLIPVVLLLAATARADTIYKWMGKDGQWHFTNEPGSIPKGQRTTITQGAELSILQIRDAPSSPSGLERQGRLPPPEASAEDRKPNEDAWRSRFREAKRHIDELESFVASDKDWYERVKDVSSSSTVARTANGYQQQTEFPSERAKDKLSQDQKALDQAKQELEDLERTASSQAIPREWRQ